jgi:transposase
VTAPRLGHCWLRAAQSYPQAKTIYLIIDSWPVHFHPKALQVLAQDPRLELINLPTYAPWLNAIEKLWRRLRQRVAHAHP